MTTLTGARSITYIRMGDVKPAVRNAKKHDVDAIRDSFRHYGFNDPVEVDERTGRLTSGHGRFEALVEHKAAGEAPPDGILVDDDGEWLLPAVRGFTSRNDAHAEGYIITANRTQELGGVDDRVLAQMLEDAQVNEHDLFEAMRYDADDLEALLRHARDGSDLPGGQVSLDFSEPKAKEPAGESERADGDGDGLGVDHGMTDVPAGPEHTKVRCPECGHRFVAGDR